MPSPRLDDANIEYNFTEDELVIARMLDPLKVMYYQTLYAQLWKKKNSIPMPSEMTLDRDFLLNNAELEGRMNMLQELMDAAKPANAAYSEAVKETAGNAPPNGNMQAISYQAGQLVNGS